MSVHEDVQQTMRRVLAELDGDTHIALSPTLLATRTFDLFSEESTEVHIQWASVEHFKALARRMLARQYDHESDDNEAYQGDMFAGELQDRYPIPRAAGDDPVYKPRALLSVDELDWNIAQLRKSADARLRHADALQAFRDDRYADQAA